MITRSIDNYAGRCFTVADLPKTATRTDSTATLELTELEVAITPTGAGNLAKALVLDSVIVPLFKAAPALQEAAAGVIHYFGEEEIPHLPDGFEGAKVLMSLREALQASGWYGYDRKEEEL